MYDVQTYMYPSVNRHDMTFAVDWALKTNLLSIYPSVSKVLAAVFSCFRNPANSDMNYMVYVIIIIIIIIMKYFYYYYDYYYYY